MTIVAGFRNDQFKYLDPWVLWSAASKKAVESQDQCSEHGSSVYVYQSSITFVQAPGVYHLSSMSVMPQLFVKYTLVDPSKQTSYNTWRFS